MGTEVFHSRWVERPEGVSEVDPAQLPAGFRASGIAAGIKSSSPDLGLVVCDSSRVTSAARFTKNAVLGAPVQLNLAEASLDTLRAVVVNSGNANVCTGSEGLEIARKMRDLSADALGIHHHHIAVASTGVIGTPPPVEKLVTGLPLAVEGLSAEGGSDFAQAILTTDRAAKNASLIVDIADREIRLSAQIKGAGMLAPAFSSATLLCFIETDAVVEPSALQQGLDCILAASLERATVDAQLSTSDSFFLFASGESGVDCSGSEQFFEALHLLLLQLALDLVGDGEGATRITRLVLKGAQDQNEAERVARAVSDSALVKTAAFGGDPNWGRVIQAVGGSIGMHAHHRETVEPSLWLEQELLCDRGVACYPDSDRSRFAELASQAEVEMTVDLHRGDHETEIYFSDLTHEYIDLNSSYS